MNLIHKNDPVLRKNVLNKEVDFNEVHKIYKNLVNLMISKNGIGLSANQVGIEQPFFVTNGIYLPEIICYPKLIAESNIFKKQKEGCLSFPELKLPINRSVEIEVEFFDLNQKFYKTIFVDFSARLFLHEYDHLQGVLFIDKVPKLTLCMALEKMRKGKNHA